MIMDELYARVAERGYVCLGLDTAPDYIPADFAARYPSVGERLLAFNRRIVDATADIVACYKVQISYYEACGLQGLAAYRDTLRYVREKGVPVIADVKRGDIASTAAQYAKAHFTGDFEADFVTLNPYMGFDTLEPWLPYFESGRKGAFALVRTSNPGAKDIEYRTCEGKRIYEVVGEGVRDVGARFVGRSGYSGLGAVVGCTDVAEAARLRAALNTVFFLIPGYGAQGGGAAEIATLLRGGNGGVVNSSRAILLGYRKHPGGEARFDEYARMEAVSMNEEIRRAITFS